ncbi:hypothetical protein DFJ74DRAFT_706442 [Hyaloraphidium curvatum]|nr:hypothetical protein DFJ74DRAFT_706442 [Hyaloraphidium curvatum]
METAPGGDGQPALPPELLVPIMRILGAGGRQRTLLRLMFGNRTYFHLGLPHLLRNLRMVGAKAKAWEHFLQDHLNTGKLRYVRVLHVEDFPTAVATLQRCVASLEQLSFFSNSLAFTAAVWHALQRASPALRHMELELLLTAKFFHETTCFPPSVEVVGLKLYDATPDDFKLLNNLESGAPGLAEFHFRSAYARRIPFERHPTLLAKLRSITVPRDHLRPFLALPGVRLRYLNLLSNGTLDRELWTALCRASTALERLDVERLQTSLLAAGVPPGLRTLALHSPIPTLEGPEYADVLEMEEARSGG